MIRRSHQARSYILALLAVLFVFVAAAVPTIRADAGFPDTPAGHALQAFLDAFNSGDHDRIAAYVKQYDPTNNADGLASFSSQTGGFNFVSVVRSQPDRLDFLVHGRGDNIDAYGILQLASTSPPQVKRLNIRALPPGAKPEDIQLDAGMRQKVIDAISKQLTDHYVYPDVAIKMIDAVHGHLSRGDYNSITDGNEFAEHLTTDLRAISHDQHLFVAYNPFTTPAPPTPTPGSRGQHSADEERFRAMLEHQNCAFSKLEILNHNIGYIKFDAFPPPQFCGPTVVAAMAFVAHTNALIFDLRENHGGDPNMVDFMVSYLFADSTHVNDLAARDDNDTHQYWTLPWVPGQRFLDKPIYVLTSHGTFSGGEEFTFDLKTQKRATIVGEVTGGGAHPVRGMPATDHFTIGVPFARPINPVTKGDWEGTGVEPDVKVSAADALTTAQKLAADELAKQAKAQ
jgi:hypothetical protein